MTIPLCPDWVSLGDRAILDRPLLAYFCSRQCPGRIASWSFDLAQRWRATDMAVIGGFHAPMEQEVLRIMLRSDARVCLLLARNLPRRLPPDWRRALEEDRLLMLADAGKTTRRATRATAAARNHLAAAFATSIFVAYAAPGSQTESFCRYLAKVGKPCLTFADPLTNNLTAIGFTPVSAPAIPSSA